MFERGLKNSFIENEVTLKILQQTGDQEKLYLLHKSWKPLFHSKIHRSFFGFFFNVMSPNSIRNENTEKK